MDYAHLAEQRIAWAAATSTGTGDGQRAMIQALAGISYSLLRVADAIDRHAQADNTA